MKTSKDFSDGHLWYSVISRPASSNFTSVQRVSCCFSLSLCTMLTSIMFYGIPTDPSEQTMDLGRTHFHYISFCFKKKYQCNIDVRSPLLSLILAWGLSFNVLFKFHDLVKWLVVYLLIKKQPWCNCQLYTKPKNSILRWNTYLLFCVQKIKYLSALAVSFTPLLLSLFPGHFEFTWQQFMVGVQSSLIMFPVNILIVSIFRNTRPREPCCCKRRTEKPDALEQTSSSQTATKSVNEDVTLETVIKVKNLFWIFKGKIISIQEI